MGHGIDSTRHIPAHIQSTGTVRLMTSGRIAPTKRLDAIIASFLLLKKSGVPATLSIFGAPTSPEGEEYKALLSQRLIGAGENPEHVFLGSVPNAHMPERRAAMDYFLHASETGSLDKAVLDAVLSGVIPISSSEAYRTLFAGFEEYLIYSIGDSVALAERVRTLELLSQEERTRIREILKKRVTSEHSLENLVPRMLYILQHAY